MNITIVGAGYAGLVTGACFADTGNQVLCIDKDPDKLAALRRGHVPIYEFGLESLVRLNLKAGRLAFGDDLAQGVAHGQVLFLALPTPSAADGAADTGALFEVAREIGRRLDHYCVIANKSTAPVGTAGRVRGIIGDELRRRGAALEFSVVSNPEFLKEGDAVRDFMRPDRIIVGVEPGDERARGIIEQLYAPFNSNHERLLCMDPCSAELTKYAANAMLATRISFMNEMAVLAEALGADIQEVRRGIGSDSRIGYGSIYAGCGFGGSCLPKDIRALRHSARTHDCEARILAAVAAVNEDQVTMTAQKVVAHFNGRCEGLRLALWGLAFKPGTDDVREAPALALARRLLEQGAEIRACDPAALDEAARALGGHPRLSFHGDHYEAAEGCDAVLLVTEWRVFKDLDLERLARIMRQRVIVDGRNIYRPAALAAAGFHYYGIGRGGGA